MSAGPIESRGGGLYAAREVIIDPDAPVILMGGDAPTRAGLAAALFELGMARGQAAPPLWTDDWLDAAIDREDLRGCVEVLRGGDRRPRRFWATDRKPERLLARLPQAVLTFVWPSGKTLPTDFRSAAKLAELPESFIQAVEAAGNPVVWVDAADLKSSPAAFSDAIADLLGIESRVLREAATLWLQQLATEPHLATLRIKTQGYIDRATPTGVQGWAVIEGMAGAVSLQIIVNGRPSAHVRADQLRQALKERGYHPTGHCAFSFKAPPELGLKPGDEIGVRALGDPRELANSPVKVVELKPAQQAAAEDDGPAIELPSFPRSAPRSSGAIMWQTMRALWLRTLSQRFAYRRGGYVWALLEPALQIALLVIVVRGLRGRYDGTIYGQEAVYFFALGIIPFIVFQNIATSCLGAIGSGGALYNFRQVRPFDLVFVRASLEFVIYSIVFLIYLAGMAWWGISVEIADPLQVVISLVLLYGLALGFGLLVDVISTFVEQVRMVFQMVLRVLFFTSGIFFTIEALPAWLRPYLIWNPVLHAVDAIRGASMPGYDSQANLGYLAFVVAVGLFLGLAAYRRYQYRLY